MKYMYLVIVIVTLGSCHQNEYENICKSNIEIASRYFTEIYNQDKIYLIDELFTDNYTHINTEGREFNGRDNIKSAINQIKSTLPNLTVEITEASADAEKVIFLTTFNADLPKGANPNTKVQSTSFNETFIFWVSDDKIHKGRSSGAHVPLIKQISGFEGSIIEIISILSEEQGSGIIEF